MAAEDERDDLRELSDETQADDVLAGKGFDFLDTEGTDLTEIISKEDLNLEEFLTADEVTITKLKSAGIFRDDYFSDAFKHTNVNKKFINWNKVNRDF